MTVTATIFNVNGALADSLVTDWGGIFAPTVGLAPDARVCLTLNYSSAAQTQLFIFLAEGAGAAAEMIVTVYNSATQLNPGADLTDSITNLQVQIPFFNVDTPMQLRITKAATNARIRCWIDVKAGPGC